MGSLLDSLMTVDELVEKAKEYNMPAVAVTNHGAMHDFLRFYKKAKKEGIKSIFGCELYITNAPDMKIKDKEEKRYHLITLAKNKEGLSNLFKLITIANKEGFYYKPRIDFKTLKEYSEGLIVTTACLGGEIPSIVMEDMARAKDIVYQYKDVFSNDFYIEIMSNKMEEQYKVNHKLHMLAQQTDTKLVGTNDIHYTNKKDFKSHEVMLAVQTKAKMKDKNRFKLPKNEFYFKSYNEMLEGFFLNGSMKDVAHEALKNTLEINDKIEQIDFTLGEIRFPEYEVPEKYTTEEFLDGVAHYKLKELSKKEDIPYYTYKKRLKHELKIIKDKGFSAYFFIVADFVRWAKDNGIMVGAGRGSAGGSLLSYLMEITAIDPMKYGLLFSRFLNPEREAMPDIDIDFSRVGRERVIDYVKDKYGEENVAHLCTFGTLSTKSVLKDVGRALDYNFQYMNNKVVKAIPDDVKNIGEAIRTNSNVEEYAKKHADLFKYASKLEGKPRHLGTHACAIAITPEPVTNIVPLARTNNGIVTQTEMGDSEQLGMLKMDFLGLKTLDILENTARFIQKRDDLDSYDFIPTPKNMWELPLDVEEVYENIYQKSDTNGVFQTESQLFKKLLGQMKPTKFEDIIAILALGRPSTLEAGIVDDFIDRKNGLQTVEYPHEDLEEVLEETYGFMLYQEQVLKIAQIIGGFSLGKADILRRAIGKKKEKLMDSLKEDFINGAIDKGYKEDFAVEMFELVEYFAGYGFNKSHSTAYAITSYATAYLKNFFHTEFYASLMTFEAKKAPKNSNLTTYISDCYRKDIGILPPDINDSELGFTPINNGEAIRFGLGSIKGIGDKGANDILEKRPFDSLSDLYNRVNRRIVNKTVFEALIKSGALDRFGDSRKGLLEEYGKLRKDKAINLSLFDMSTEDTREEIIQMEYKTLGMSVSHPSKWDKLAVGGEIKFVGEITELNEITTKNDNLMAFAKFKTSRVEMEMVIFPTLYKKHHGLLHSKPKVVVFGEKGYNSSLVALGLKEYNPEEYDKE